MKYFLSEKNNPKELSILNNELKNEVQLDFEQTGNKIGNKMITWFGSEFIKINDKTALKFSYLRQLENNPYVVVNVYQLPYDNKVIHLVMSYRQEAEITYKPLFLEILNSFLIINDKFNK